MRESALGRAWVLRLDYESAPGLGSTTFSYACVFWCCIIMGVLDLILNPVHAGPRLLSASASSTYERPRIP